MKFNIYQKILLLIYGCLFVYFSIIHVPFKTNYRNEIKYDTLFSNSSNLDVSRLVLIIVILSILAVVLFLLFRNITYSYKFKQIRKRKIFYSAIGVLTIFLAVFIIILYQNKNKINEAIPSTTIGTADSTSVSTDSTSVIPPLDVIKAFTCTEENALANFKSYMKFYYPDWKIYGSPVVKDQSDCTYRIQFTTLDPHIRYEREVMIVEISYNYDYSRYSFRTIRGTLY